VLILFLLLVVKGFGLVILGLDIFLVTVEPTRCDLPTAGENRGVGRIMRGDEETTLELILLVMLVLEVIPFGVQLISGVNVWVVKTELLLLQLRLIERGTHYYGVYI
jgi:hypothetical protein